MVLKTITALIMFYLTLSLAVMMPCIAHNTQHCCLWILARYSVIQSPIAQVTL